jgi:hypothetical protein
VYDTFAEFRYAMRETIQSGSLTAYKRLMRRAEVACGESRAGKIATKGPMVLTVLAKRAGYPQLERSHESGNPRHLRKGQRGADPRQG